MYRKKTIIGISILLFITSLFSIKYFGERMRTSPEDRYKDWKKPDNVLEKQLGENQKNRIKKTNITIAATGDIMFHTPQIIGAYDSQTGIYDFYSTFEPIKKFIEAADIALGNLETVTAGSEHGFTGYPRFNSPEACLKALKEVGYDILSTANNHSLDRGREGIIETIENINSHGMENIGTYKEPEHDILIKNIKGIRVAFLSYTYGCNGLESLLTKNELDYMVNIINEEKIKRDIERAQELGSDVTTVFIHWGSEYKREPTQEQIDLAQKMIQWGADIILGSHPHVIQKSEIIKQEGENKFIIYSMGNFISNQRYETVNNRYTEDGIIVKINVEKDFSKGKTIIKDIDYIPTWVYRYQQDGKFKYEILPVEEYLEREDISLTENVITRMQNSYESTMKLMDK